MHRLQVKKIKLPITYTQSIHANSVIRYIQVTNLPYNEMTIYDSESFTIKSVSFSAEMYALSSPNVLAK